MMRLKALGAASHNNDALDQIEGAGGAVGTEQHELLLAILTNFPACSLELGDLKGTVSYARRALNPALFVECSVLHTRRCHCG